MAAYRRKNLFELWLQRDGIHHIREAGQPAASVVAGAESWEFSSTIGNGKQGEGTEADRSYMIWKPAPSGEFPTARLSIQASPNSATSWDPTIQMSKPVGDISFSNQYTHRGLGMHYKAQALRVLKLQVWATVPGSNKQILGTFEKQKKKKKDPLLQDLRKWSLKILSCF